jgi:hypothetical protein
MDVFGESAAFILIAEDGILQHALLHVTYCSFSMGHFCILCEAYFAFRH